MEMSLAREQLQQLIEQLGTKYVMNVLDQKVPYLFLEPASFDCPGREHWGTKWL